MDLETPLTLLDMHNLLYRDYANKQMESDSLAGAQAILLGYDLVDPAASSD